MVRVCANGAMGRRIDPLWWTQGARCSSVVRVCVFMVQWVVGSILYGGPKERDVALW